MPFVNLDAIDLKILDALQGDGRLSNADLADLVGLSASPCLRRVKRLEREGFITSYRAILDRHSVGLSLTIFAQFKLGSATADAAAEFEASLTAIPQVVTCHMLSGDSDCLTEIVAPSVAAYQDLLNNQLRSLPHVRDIRSNIALKLVKSETPMPLEHIKRPLDGPDC